MSEEVEPLLTEKEQCVFLTCMSCNCMIAVVGHKAKCTLRSLTQYNEENQQVKEPTLANLFAFTVCAECDESDNRSDRPMYIQPHIEYAIGCKTYMIALDLVNGNLDTAIISGRVAFISRERIHSMFIEDSYVHPRELCKGNISWSYESDISWNYAYCS